MKVSGLENNYYLCGNDIWVTLNEFSGETKRLDVLFKNVSTGETLPPFMLYPSPKNDYSINVCGPIRALFENPNHTREPLNTLQEFTIEFKAYLDETTEEISLNKSFLFGSRNKQGKNEWFLSLGQELIIGSWVQWDKVMLPGFPYKISETGLEKFGKVTPDKIMLRSCNYKLVKFLNSLGGYQYWVFETFELKHKTKAGKILSVITDKLRKDNFQNISNSIETSIELKTKTPAKYQCIITDLISSYEVFLYDESGDDNDSKWTLLQHENNNCVENKFDSVFENKISFSFSNYKTIGQ